MEKHGYLLIKRSNSDYSKMLPLGTLNLSLLFTCHVPLLSTPGSETVATEAAMRLSERPLA